MKKINIEVGDKQYTVLVAEKQEDKKRGLRNVQSMGKDRGMLFVWDKPQKVSMTMDETLIPLDQIFINDDWEVIKVEHRDDMELDRLVECNDTLMVLEVNINSGIKEGDYFDTDELDDQNSEDKLPAMKVLAPDGSTQMELEGGERIVSRRETKILIRKAKNANKVKGDKQAFERKCKELGKYMFKVLKGQDNREPEYVESPKEN